jgi:hypothetical protein
MSWLAPPFVVAFNVFVLVVLMLLNAWSTREAPNYWE